MNEWSWAPTELYLCALRFEMHIIFMKHMIFFYHYKCKNLSYLAAYKKTSSQRFGPGA